MVKSKTLYVSDMDGTLLNSDSRVSERTKALLNRAAEAGVMFTVATARTPATVTLLLSGLRTDVEAVVMTGAAVYDLRTGLFGELRSLPEALLNAAFTQCHSRGIHPFAYFPGADGRILDVYHEASMLNSAEESYYRQRCELPLKRFHLNSVVPERSGLCLLLYCMGSASDIMPAAAPLRAAGLSVSCYPDIEHDNITNLEMVAPGVSKASAIRCLAERHHADRIVVFGDNLNDLPMFAVADTAVAVGNALESVKSAADIVIGRNDEDAVAEYICKEEGL